jgi:glycosyltransferase involved in cell wall biosynthesis
LRALAALKARDLPTPHVILVGDGAERDQIVSESRKLAVSDSVTLAGAVDDVRPYLAAADVFVLPSIAVETFSNAALEASAMGLRCVISDVGGAHEMFPDGSFGVVYHRESMDELTDALATAVRSGRPTTEDRDAVRTDILSRFGIDGMVEDWKEILWPSTAVDRQAAG